MKYLNFYKTNNLNPAEVVTLNKPAPEQIAFANSVLVIFSVFLEHYGFTRTNTDVLKNQTTIIFQKKKQYIKIYGSTYPTDYPYTYDVILGEVINTKAHQNEWDWITLWQFKNKVDGNNLSQEYDFPYLENVELNIINARDELLKYAESFLNSNMDLFYITRAEVNKARGPFTITIIKDNPSRRKLGSS